MATTASMIDATQIQFGEKAQDYVSTKIDGGFIRFALGSVDAPLRAPFGVSEPMGGGQASRKTMIKVFDMLGKGDELATRYRRKMFTFLH